MAAGTRNLGFQLNVDQILAEAQRRWLKTPEIVEILRSHNQFVIDTEAPNKPDSGSVYLLNRNVVKHFRKDGHNWRKANNRSTNREGHENLKVGKVDMVKCYYAYSEDYEYFQRRSYWLLQQDLAHVVFVHYLEAKCNKAYLSPSRNRDSVVLVSNSCVDLSSPRSTLSSSHGDAGSGGNSDRPMDFASFSKACAEWDFGSTGLMSGETTVGLASTQEALENDTSGEIVCQQNQAALRLNKSCGRIALKTFYQSACP